MNPAPMPLPPPPEPPVVRVPFPWLAALLSYIVPGLGQIAQGVASKNWGRFAKGVMFAVILLGMFHYGQALGRWRVVYLPHYQDFLLEEEKNGFARDRYGNPRPPYKFFLGDSYMSPLVGNLYVRWQFIAQFWIGAAAWPACWNYAFPDWPLFGSYQASPGALKSGEAKSRNELLNQFEDEENDLEREMGRMAILAWMYTVVAGALNLLVIYDAYSGPVRFRREPAPTKEKTP
jgi:hypothetical protein